MTLAKETRRKNNMISQKSHIVKRQFEKYCKQICEDNEQLVIEFEDEPDVVMITQEYFNELEKARENAEYLKKLDESFSQADSLFPNFHPLGFD